MAEAVTATAAVADTGFLGAFGLGAIDDLVRRISFLGEEPPAITSAAASTTTTTSAGDGSVREGKAGAGKSKAAAGKEEGDEDDQAVNDANIIADAAKRQAEHEEMSSAACIIQCQYRKKKVRRLGEKKN